MQSRVRDDFPLFNVALSRGTRNRRRRRLRTYSTIPATAEHCRQGQASAERNADHDKRVGSKLMFPICGFNDLLLQVAEISAEVFLRRFHLRFYFMRCLAHLLFSFRSGRWDKVTRASCDWKRGLRPQRLQAFPPRSVRQPIAVARWTMRRRLRATQRRRQIRPQLRLRRLVLRTTLHGQLLPEFPPW